MSDTPRIDWRVRWRRWRAHTGIATAMDTLGLLAVLALVLYWQGRQLLPADGTRMAPTLTAPRLAGGQLTLEPALSEHTVVYFFAPWCSVCEASFDNLADLQRARGPDTLQIVVVALDWRDPAEVQAFIDRHEGRFPVLLGDSRIARDWRVRAYPTYYVIDRRGVVTGHAMGYSTEIGLRLRT